MSPREPVAPTPKVSVPWARIAAGLVAVATGVLCWLAASPWALLGLPVLIGAATGALAPVASLRRIDSWTTDFARLRHWATGSGRHSRVWGVTEFAKYGATPTLGGGLWLWASTEDVSQPTIRASVRVAALIYVALLSASLFAAVLAFWAAVLAGLLLLNAALSMMGAGEDSSTSEPARRRSSGWSFSTECAHCGSKEHATDDCPHGLFSDKCTHCGSKNHATDACPHGLFSDKCIHCGSRDHSTDECPHGMFSDECVHCGSRNHSTSDCPHGMFSDKCAHCGSKHHSTDNCPH